MLGFKQAFRGLWLMLKSERNFKIQLVIFILVLFLGFYFQINQRDWLLLLLMSVLVLSLEIINSALEKTCNLVSTKYHPLIRDIKDISAGAVLIAALFAVVVGIIVFMPYLKEL